MPFGMSNWRLALYIFVISFTALTLIVTISDSTIICLKTHNCQPLADATLGQFLGGQSLIVKDIQHIKDNPNEDATMVELYKNRIVQNVTISIFMIWLIWRIVEGIFGLGIPVMERTTWFHILTFLGTLLIIYLSNVCYLGFRYNQWQFIPFFGFFDPQYGLIFNLNILINSFGIITNPLMNNTINSTGVI